MLDASLTLRLDSGISLRDVPAGEVGGVDTWTIAVVAGALEKIDVAHIERVSWRRKTVAEAQRRWCEVGMRRTEVWSFKLEFTRVGVLARACEALKVFESGDSRGRK